MDLAETSGDTGRYFAAAKDAGFYDLALKFAEEGRTDPRTLSRASRDFGGKEPTFAMTVGRLALQRLLQGHGYEITSLDVLDARMGTLWPPPKDWGSGSPPLRIPWRWRTRRDRSRPVRSRMPCYGQSNKVLVPDKEAVLVSPKRSAG